VVCAVGPSVNAPSTDFSFQNLVFKILFEFSAAEIPLILKSVKKSFNIQELLQHMSKMSRNQAHAPLLIESFQKTPRTQSEASWFSESHNYKTNYLPA
jgi:hypothetical protein